MRAPRLLLVTGLLALLVLALLAWLWGRGPEAPSASAETTERFDPGFAAADAGPPPPALVERSPALAAGVPEAMTVRGRCVDPAAVPVAGARIGRPAVAAALATSDADGVFALPVAVGSEPFALVIGADGFVDVTQEFARSMAGTVLELGDVVLQPGCVVRGTVRQSDGAPVAHGRLLLRAVGAWSAGFAPRAIIVAVIDGTGAFTAVVPGQASWVEFSVSGFEDVQPRARNLRPELNHVEIALVALRSASEVLTSGRVLDDGGQPLEGAVVFAHGRPQFTGPDGAFELWGRSAFGPALGLRVEHADCESRDVGGITPGTRGLDVVLTRGRRLLLELRHAGQPVDHAEVVLETRERRRRSPWRVARRGPFVDGLADLGVVPPGSYDLVVAPPATPQSGPPAAVTRQVLELDAATVSPLRIEFATGCERPVEVRRNGAPLAGARCELLAGNGAPVAFDTRAMPPGRWSSYREYALLVHDVTTGSDGSAVLYGPVGEALTLRVTGPRHIARLVEAVRLDAAGPVVVEVDAGGRLDGSLVPPAAFAALAASTGATAPATQVFVRLLGRGPAQGWLPASREHDPNPAFAVGPDGVFHIGGVPAGDWDVEIEARPLPPRTGFFRTRLGAIRVGELAILREQFDVTGLVPAVLTGVARIGGLEAAFARVEVAVERDDCPTVHFEGTADAAGRFELQALAGRWLVRFATSASADPDAMLPPSAFRRVVWPEALPLLPGERRAQDFDLAPGEVRLQFVVAGGQPVRGLGIEARTAGGLHRARLGITDVDGHSQPLLAEVGRFHLFALPRRLMDPAVARAEAAARGVGLGALVVEVGVVDVRAAAREVVVTMPVAWSQ